MGRQKKIKAQRRAERATSELGPSLTPERFAKLMEYGAAERTPDGVAINPEVAWKVDPWLWLPARSPEGDEMIRRAGTDPPVAYFLNRDYQVSVFDESGKDAWPDMWHLSIKRRDRAPLDENRWRILQHIKNEIVGPENEAVELYPAESRLVDTANQYHLFVIKQSGIRFPFGFPSRLVTGTSSHGAVQRPPDGDVGPLDDALVAAMMDQVVAPAGSVQE